MKHLLNRCPYWNIGSKCVKWEAQFISKTCTLPHDVGYRLKMINDAMTDENFVNTRNVDVVTARVLKDKQKELTDIKAKVKDKNLNIKDVNDGSLDATWENAPYPHNMLLIKLTRQMFEETHHVLSNHMDKIGIEARVSNRGIL